MPRKKPTSAVPVLTLTPPRSVLPGASKAALLKAAADKAGVTTIVIQTRNTLPSECKRCPHPRWTPRVSTPTAHDRIATRICVNLKCGRPFIPDSPQDFHCSVQCIQAYIYDPHAEESAANAKRRAIERAAATTSETPHPEPLVVKPKGKHVLPKAVTADPGPSLSREERDAQMEARWGPYRDVKQVLRETSSSLRVLFVCGHEYTVAKSQSKRARCMECRAK
jgi:hypothetical protein